MRREMEQLAALVEAAAAGEAWAAEDGPAFANDSVVTERLLGPSRNFLPTTALLILGGTSLAFAGWLAMLIMPGLAALTLGRRFAAWSWRWCDDRAGRELRAVLPRFARARLQHFDGGAVRLSRGGRYAASGMALIQAPDGGWVLLMVEQGVCARIPTSLIQGWVWEARGQSGVHGAHPSPPPTGGFTVAVAGAQQPTWHFACDDPAVLRLWGQRLTG